LELVFVSVIDVAPLQVLPPSVDEEYSTLRQALVCPVALLRGGRVGL
jgi:hypothetical protein